MIHYFRAELRGYPDGLDVIGSSGIAQGHTPILGLPPSPGSDTSATPFPQSQNDFCVALLLHQTTR